MAQAALKYETEPQETLLIPEGGIATFLTATEGDWADEKDIPQNGIAQVTHIADRLAEYGRHEDEYMVHAAEGETVIPMAVLEANPHLRKNLFAQMEIMGLDPERYVVGNELNSINPVTGQPEFFLKKLFKGVKKLVKKVVKVVKKALPYVLPIVLSMTPLGPIWGAALGSGIGTLMQGGDLGDALKSAVIAGGIGGLTAGISGGIQAQGAGGAFGEGFKTGVQGAAGNVGQRFGQALGGARPEGAGYWGSPFRPVEAPAPALEGIGSQVGGGTVADVAGNIVGGPPRPLTDFSGRPIQYQPPGAPTPEKIFPWDRPMGPQGGPPNQPPGAPTPEKIFPWDRPMGPQGGPPTDFSGRPIQYDASVPSTEPFPWDRPLQTPLDTPTMDAQGRPLADISGRPIQYDAPPGYVPPDSTLKADQGWFGKTWDTATGWVQDYLPAGQRQGRYDEVFNRKIAEGASKKVAGRYAADAVREMGILAEYGPTLAATGAITGAMGGFDPPEPEEDEDEDDPFKDHDPLAYQQYQIAFPTAPTYTMEDIRVPGREVGFAQGGVASLEEARAFPPRSGGISGPGTGRSDDVPAMLSDGEFVMTAKAVNGAGNGNRRNGMKNMYQMMRTFEANA